MKTSTSILLLPLLLEYAIAKSSLTFLQPLDAFDSPPCSCDCCTTMAILPTEMSPGRGTKVCKALRPARPDELEICPTRCSVKKDQTAVMKSAVGPLDTDRFCTYSCQALVDEVGAGCVQLQQPYREQALADKSGNGVDQFPPPVDGIGSKLGDLQGEFDGNVLKRASGAAASEGAVEPVGDGSILEDGGGAAGAAVVGAHQQRVQVIYDMRKLIAERMRSEAGSSIAAGAASSEQVRIKQWQTNKYKKQLSELALREKARGEKLAEGVESLDGDVQIATASKTKAKKFLNEGLAFQKKLLQQVKLLSDKAIEQAVAPCIDQAARTHAEARVLDKPDDWGKVVAARAADPYQRAVTTAVQRTDEYKRLADGLQDRAQSAIYEADKLNHQVNVMQAQGDIVGTAIGRRHVRDLFAQSQRLQEEAQGYWNTANSIRQTIPQWQTAAAQSAAYASWQYDQIKAGK